MEKERYEDGGFGLQDDPSWKVVAQQAQRYEQQREKQLHTMAEQKKLLDEEEQLAKQQRSPLVPDFFYTPLRHPERIFENCAFKSAFGGIA